MELFGYFLVSLKFHITSVVFSILYLTVTIILFCHVLLLLLHVTSENMSFSILTQGIAILIELFLILTLYPGL